MANWGQKVYPSDYAEIKALLKAEVGRRGKTEGTARGQSVGSMASYNGSAYDFSTQPTAGAYIKNEHIQKITKPLDAIKGTSITPENGAQITASRLSQAAAVLSELSAIPENAASSGCSGRCSGLCSTGCNTACTSCTGSCTGNCTGSCVASCANDCAGGCKGSCQGTCTGSCTGTCTRACANNCSSTCTGSCTGSCTIMQNCAVRLK